MAAGCGPVSYTHLIMGLVDRRQQGVEAAEDARGGHADRRRLAGRHRAVEAPQHVMRDLRRQREHDDFGKSVSDPETGGERETGLAFRLENLEMCIRDSVTAMSSTESLEHRELGRLYRDHHGWLRGWLLRRLNVPAEAARCV